MPLLRLLPLVLAVLALSACGGSPAAATPASPPPQKQKQKEKEKTADPAPAPPGDRGTTVKISDFAYHPKTLTVKAGTRVTWTNRDSANHTVTADDHSFDVGNVPGGAKGSHTFTKAGAFTYHCTYHPFMHGRVVVR